MGQHPRVEPVHLGTLPRDIATLHVVDFVDPGVDGAFALAAAVANTAPRRPLPDPLPRPPMVPLSYLSELAGRVHAAALTLDEQLALVARLKAVVEAGSDDSAAALALLGEMRRRRDLYHAVVREIDGVRTTGAPQALPGPEHVPVGGGRPAPSSRWIVEAHVESPSLIVLEVRCRERHRFEYRWGVVSDTARMDGRRIANMFVGGATQFVFTDGGVDVRASLVVVTTAALGRVKSLQLNVGDSVIYAYPR